MKIHHVFLSLACLLMVSSCSASQQFPDQIPALADTSSSDHLDSSSSTDKSTGALDGPPGLLAFDPSRIDTNFAGLTEQIHRWGIVDEINRGLDFAPRVPGIQSVSDEAIAQALGIELAYRGKSKRVQAMGPYDRTRKQDRFEMGVSSGSRTGRIAPSGQRVVAPARLEGTGAAKWADDFLARLGITAGCEGVSVQGDTMGMGSGADEVWFMGTSAKRLCLIAGREVFNMSAFVSIGKQGDLTSMDIEWPEITGSMARTDGAKWTETGLREFIATEVFKLREHTLPVSYVSLGYTVRDGLLVPTISVGGTSGNTKNWGDFIELGSSVTPR